MAGNRFGSILRKMLAILSQKSRDTSRVFHQSQLHSVAPDERISTFVYHRDHIVAKTKTIRYTRLLPRRHHSTARGRLELSICRSGELSDAGIWSICSQHFDPHAPKPATGRCDARATVVLNVGLAFDPDGFPYPEHANVIGWRDHPTEPEEKLKHFWMDQAQRMAPHFLFVPRAQ